VGRATLLARRKPPVSPTQRDRSTPPRARDCGPRDPAGPKIRPSRTARWRALALVLVHGLVALHVAHWMANGTTLSPLEPSEAMEFSKHDLVNAGFVFFGLTILSTLVLGRWFCGWACHVVALQDGSLWLLKKLGIHPRPLRSRLLAWVPALAALYMFAWPLVYRVWNGLGPGSPRVALTREDFWATFPPWPVALATFAVCGSAVVYFLGAKGFCTYACPYGAIFGAVDRLAPGRIRVTDACEGCGHCTATCSSNVLVHEEVRAHGMVVDPGCMKCLDCVSVCPKDALYFGFGKPAIGSGARAAHRAKKGAPWGQELSRGLAFVLAFLTFRGLYGVVPFLLALGLAGLLAPCFAELVRLFTSSRVSFLGRVLKQDGRLTGAGRWFAGTMGAVSILCLHSALIQTNDWRRSTGFEALMDRREAFLADPARRLEGAELERATRARASAEFVRRNGLLPWLQNDVQGAWLALFAGEPERFESELRSLAERAPDAGALHYDLARFLAVRGELDRAAEELGASLAARPSAPVFDRLARLQWELGRPDQALETFRSAREAFPDNPDLAFNQGVLFGFVGQDEAAAEAFRAVLALAPDRRDARENLAGILQAQGRLDEARALLDAGRDGSSP